jgi:hypothetical protein
MINFRIPLNAFHKIVKKSIKVFTLARTFSNEAGLTSEKQIRKTS